MGQIFQNVFEDHQGGDGIEAVLTFLDNNAMIEISTAKRFRDWVCSYSFLNTGETFSKLFLIKIAEKDTKPRDSCPQVFCKVDTNKNFVKFTGKHLYRSPLLNKVEVTATGREPTTT